MKQILFTICFGVQTFGILNAHNVHYGNPTSKTWQIQNESLTGSFLFYRNDSVFIETGESKQVAYLLSQFCESDQKYLQDRIASIASLNNTVAVSGLPESNHTPPGSLSLLLAMLLLTGLVFYTWKKRGLRRYLTPMIGVGFGALLLSFTDPNTIRSAFLPFAPNVNTFWDANYLYVESKGIPTTHTMMVGISNHGWQQQVPIPQCYVGTNAWSIPLNPTMATNPIPVDQTHFTRGAIAIAVNGVPIFNPYTNTGVDAYLDGQLDSFGGHSGRGDDYHYHTAPLHLYNHTATSLPIAYAFDGYAVFGATEPNGDPMASLDANHGHSYNGTYHYHGTATAPYMIARFAGEVTEDNTHQLIPQAQAQPVRTENWTPLNGALITALNPNSLNNGYDLSYSLNGVSGYGIQYSWNGTAYTFQYITPASPSTINYNGFLQCAIPVSISDFMDESDNSVFPNPFSNHIQFKKDNPDALYLLYDAMGNQIFSGKDISQQNFSALPAGNYFLQVNFQTRLFPLVKQ